MPWLGVAILVRNMDTLVGVICLVLDILVRDMGALVGVRDVLISFFVYILVETRGFCIPCSRVFAVVFSVLA